MPLAVKTWSPNHWTTRECLSCSHFRFLIATYALFCLSWNEGLCKLMATRREQDALVGMFFTGCCSAQIFGVTSQESLKSQGRVDAQQVCLPMFHCIYCPGVQDSRIIFFSSVRPPLPCSWMIGWPSGWGGDGSTQLPNEWGLFLWVRAQQWGWEVGEVDRLAGSESGWRDLQGHAVYLNLWDSLPCELIPGWVNPFICQMPTICRSQCQAAVGQLCCHFVLLMGCTGGLERFVVYGQLDEVGKSHQWWRYLSISEVTAACQATQPGCWSSATLTQLPQRMMVQRRGKGLLLSVCFQRSWAGETGWVTWGLRITGSPGHKSIGSVFPSFEINGSNHGSFSGSVVTSSHK